MRLSKHKWPESLVDSAVTVIRKFSFVRPCLQDCVRVERKKLFLSTPGLDKLSASSPLGIFTAKYFGAAALLAVLWTTFLDCSAVDYTSYSYTHTLPPPMWQQISRDSYMSSRIFESARNSGLQGVQKRELQALTPDVTRQAGTVSSIASTTTALPKRTGDATIPAKIASHYPASSKLEAEKVFRDLLVKYGQIEQQFSIPSNDVAGAVAAFIAGSYMAYRDVTFPDESFKPLVEQMRRIISGNADFAKATGAEKQELYEQMAILGMFMAGTQMALKQQPNAQVAANMKQAAKGYLEQFLKTDADRVQIAANGLVLK
jgi:hypothetical protein